MMIIAMLPRDIPFGLKRPSFLGQYWWMAFRNPFNYFKRFILACDVRKDVVERLLDKIMFVMILILPVGSS